MPTWPGSLPQLVSARGYRESPPENSIRSPMDGGVAKVRRRTTAGVRLIKCQLDLTLAQVETLDVFYDSTLQSGSLAFDWVDPRNQAAASFRFLRPPEYAPVESDAAWVASLEFEILP